MKEFETKYIDYLKTREKALLKDIAEKKELDERLIKELEKATKAFAGMFNKGKKGDTR